MKMSNGKTETLDFVRMALATLLKSDVAEIKSNASSKNTNGWNSLVQVNLILAIEEKYEINYSIEQMLEFECISDIVNATVALIDDRNC